MPNMSTSFVPEDVMKLFAQSFASGAGAAEAGARIGLARTSQAQEFKLGTQKMALQSQQLQQESQDNAAKIALQRENIQADSAMKGQQIELQHQELAKNFMMKEQQMQQDRLNFAEQIRATKAAEEARRIELAASVDKLETSNKLELAKLDVERQKIKVGADSNELVAQDRKQKEEEAIQFRKMQFLSREFSNIEKEATTDYGIKPEFATADGTLDRDKIYTMALDRFNRYKDSTSEKEKESLKPKEKKVDTTGNSQQSPSASSNIGKDEAELALAWANTHPKDPRSAKIKARLGAK